MESENFKLKGIEPGVVKTRKHGDIDFSKNLPEPVLEDLYADKFPYLEKIEKKQNAAKQSKESPE